MNIAIIGTGNVGRAIASGLLGKHDLKFGSRNPSKAKPIRGIMIVSVKDAAFWADIVILAIPYGSVEDTIDSIGIETLRGKVLVDVTNPLSPNMELALGYSTSGAEELAKRAQSAKVVKAFNYVFAANMSTGKIKGQPLTLFIAGDDPVAKSKVMKLGEDIGFEPLDVGPLTNARYLEPLAMLLIKMGYGQNMGTGIGFRLLR